MQILSFKEALKKIDFEELSRLESKVYKVFGSEYCHEGAWSLQNFLYPLPDKSDLSFVLIEKNGLCAFTVGYEFTKNWGHISRVAVDPDFQGQGLGYKIVLEQINKMLKKGIKLITVENVSTNLKAENLYKKTGFYIIEDINILNLYIKLRKRTPDEYSGNERMQSVLVNISDELNLLEFLKNLDNERIK